MSSARGPLLALGVSIALVLMAELGLAWLAPLPDPFAAERAFGTYVVSAHRPNQQYRIGIEQGLPGVEPVHAGRINQFTTNNLGFRGDELVRPRPADELRVFVVGGSSTECLVLDDTQDMSRLLQEMLQRRAPADTTVRVYNAGKSGDRSYDHLAMISQRIAHLEPDIVAVFAGINDLLGGMFGIDYLHMEPTVLTRRKLLRLLAAESQLFRRVYAVARRLRRNGPEAMQEIAFQTNYAEKAAAQRAAPATQARPRTDLDSYETNLRSIAAVIRAAGATPVFMTQATTWNSEVDPGAAEWHWMRLRLDGTFSEQTMSAALGQYNDVMRSVAEDSDALLVDLAAQLPKSLEFMHDDVHFTVRGAREAAAALAAALETRTPEPSK